LALDVDEGVWAQPLLEFLPGHDFPGTLQQDGKNLKWLAGESELRPTLALARSNGHEHQCGV